MATFVKEATRGKTLYLLRMDNSFRDTNVYLDATKQLKEAEQEDANRGHEGIGGPSFAHALAKATEYADYVETRATPENLHQFNHHGYYFFTDKTMPQTRKGVWDAKANVRSHVSR